jgi:flagellar hook-basal body complex protein FliE
MSINGIKGEFGSFTGVQQITPLEAPKTSTGVSGKNFSQVFSDAIREVDNLQKDADSKIDSVMLGSDGVQSHDAMLALEKADMAFQLMNQVRSKIIRAYEEVLRTQV